MEEQLLKNDQQLNDLENQAFDRIINIVKKYNFDLSMLIADIDTLTNTNILLILNKIDMIVNNLSVETGQEYYKFLDSVVELTIKLQNKLLRNYDEALDSDSLRIKINELKPEALDKMSVQMNTFLLSFAAQLSEKLKNSVQSASFNELSPNDLVKILKQKFDSTHSEIERSVFFTGQTMYNLGAFLFYSAQEKFAEEYDKQWMSILDKKTTEVCAALNGQVQKLEDPFVDPHSQSKFMFPPAIFGNGGLKPAFHWCRSIFILIPRVDNGN